LRYTVNYEKERFLVRNLTSLRYTVNYEKERFLVRNLTSLRYTVNYEKERFLVRNAESIMLFQMPCPLSGTNVIFSHGKLDSTIFMI
jgi:hypothetical protein